MSWDDSIHKAEIGRGKGRYFSRPALIAVILGASAGLTGLHLRYNLSDYYPFSFVVRHIEFLAESQEIERYQNLDYEYQGPAINLETPETHVFVLGESLRAAALSAYGYGRPTSVGIENQSNKIVFQRVLAVAPLTRVAVPSMLSTATVNEFASYFNYPSVLRVFDSAGFATFLASNQPWDSWGDYLPSIITSEASTVVRLGDDGSKDHYDGELVSVLRQFLADPRPKKFILIHTIGSHWGYKERYPPEEAFFGEAKYIDRYDNSVRYSDHVLTQIVKEVRAQPERVSVLFMPDHGEAIFDLAEGTLFHGVNGVGIHELSRAE